MTGTDVCTRQAFESRPGSLLVAGGAAVVSEIPGRLLLVGG